MDWISVDDDMPKDNQYVLAICESHSDPTDIEYWVCQCQEVDPGEFWLMEQNDWTQIDATHWMPLPNPPN